MQKPLEKRLGLLIWRSRNLCFFQGTKRMKKLVFALIATTLTIAGCSGNNQDALDNAEMNQPAADDLNAMSSDAANDAANAEAEALGTQAQQLEADPADNTANPTDEDEQNVSGM